MRLWRLVLIFGVLALACAGLWDLWVWVAWRPWRIVLALGLTWLLVSVRDRALRWLRG